MNNWVLPLTPCHIRHIHGLLVSPSNKWVKGQWYLIMGFKVAKIPILIEITSHIRRLTKRKFKY